MYLTETQIRQFNLSSGFLQFVNCIASKSARWGETIATTFQTTKVAEELNVTTRTITNHLKKLQELTLGEVESKRGRNGGTVVVFNQEVLSFNTKTNVVTAETKEADEIRDMMYPRSHKPQPLRRYRTKEEISRDMLLQKARKTKEWELNEKLISLPFVTKAFFYDEMEEPDTYYKAYLISRMYNAYAVTYPRDRMEQALKEGDTHAYKVNKKAMEFAEKWDVLPTRFIGSQQFNTFVRLQRELEAREINPLAYLTVQFDYVTFLAENKKARQSALPFLNSLVSNKTLERYYRQENHIMMMRTKYNLRALTTEKVPYKGMKYPVVSALIQEYLGLKLDNVVPKAMEDLYVQLTTTSQYMYTTQDPSQMEDWERKNYASNERAHAIATFGNEVLENLQEATIEERYKETISTFIKEQIALYTPTTEMVDAFQWVSLGTQILATWEAHKNDENQLFAKAFVGNLRAIPASTTKDIERMAERGDLLLFSIEGSDTFKEVARLLGEAYNVGVNTWELKEAIEHYGVEKLPLTANGMLNLTEVIHWYREYRDADK